jgi:3-oxoacyl-[acyl-carrier-protein] synthase III
VAFLHTKNVSIAGLSACVPNRVEDNMSITLLSPSEIEKLIKTTGIEKRHIADTPTCTSDLCFKAADRLINELGWKREEIDGLIFVTQTPDYILPATAPVLQKRLGLSTDCFSLDISLGCSGYVYGLSTLAGYMQSGMIKKGLLLVGDTSSKYCSPEDKSTYPLFGDTGSATALQYHEGHQGIRFQLGSDGGGDAAIMIKDGGYRNPFNSVSLQRNHVEEGISRNNLELVLDGMDVFSFGISKAPQSINELINRFEIDKETIDLFFFHQANLMMNERIRKKLHLAESKVPYSLKNFGNTSSASIPLTMVTESAGALRNGRQHIAGCGFGVGLSWGSFECVTTDLVIPDLIYYG